jgi:hypothetical protein
MNYKNKIAKNALCIMAISLALTACQKMDRPPLGDYPKDANPPDGPLRFYTAFDGTTDDPLMNAVDSIRANFPSTNPFTSITGISGSAVEGVDQLAILYPSANDFANSTSFTIAFWEKNSVPGGGSPQWLFSLASKDYWHQSALFGFFDHDGAGSTTDSAVFKFAIQDHWFEFTPSNGKMPGHLLDGDWHHMAIVYDETTSKVSYYVDGQQLTGLSPALTDLKNGSDPFGPLSFANTYGFVLGGWNKHANLGNDAPADAWIQSWQGGLDQFRLYNKVLTESEIMALVNSKL